MLHEDRKQAYEWSIGQRTMKHQEHDTRVAALVLIMLAGLAFLCFILAGVSMRGLKEKATGEPSTASPLLRALV